MSGDSVQELGSMVAADDKGGSAPPPASCPTRRCSSGPAGLPLVGSTRRCAPSRRWAGTPYFVARGKGAYVADVEGVSYIDYVQSYGASILGHAHPKVMEAIRHAAAEGTTFGAPTPREVLLGEEICSRVAGCDEVRLVSSGTEAAMSAVRLARGATGRERLVIFQGCYHGHSDALLAGGGSGIATLGLPASAGVPKSAVAETLVAPYNVVPEIGNDVAAVLVEPVAANMGLVPPSPGFLEACEKRAPGREHSSFSTKSLPGSGWRGAGLPRSSA